MHGACKGLALGALLLCGQQALAQAGRLLVGSAVTERADHLDLAIDFSCSLRYQTHTPAAGGDQVRVTLALGADCGLPPTAQFPVERMIPADGRGLVRGIELQPGLAGGAELLVNWNRVEQFVLAPAAGMRGLRLRVTRRSPAQVTLGDIEDPVARYAVNLESARQPFDPMTVQAAASALQVPVYVSEVTVEGERWYRLRAGPFGTRRDADAALRAALPRHPSAWLGIGDEDFGTDPGAGQPVGAPARRAETRADAALDEQLDAARAAMSRRRFDDAVKRLTQVTAAEDYLHRRDAAELLGLARERMGQLAQAKAVYEDYLLRYPDSPAAGRIRDRLQALRMASLPGRSGSRGGSARDGWSAWGNASQVYRRDDTRLATDAFSRNLTTQNALLTDADGLLRRRGERYDFSARTSFGYMKDLQPAGRDNRLRVSSAYVEMDDRERGIQARLGRQSRGMAGVNGLFDGLLGSWQWRPTLGSSFAVGAPVENTRRGPDTRRLFLGTSLDLAGRNRRWEASVFAISQQFDGRTDRRSLGVEARYLQPGRTLVATTDYDVYFGELNNVLLLGTWITDSRWTFNLDANRQRSPMLSIRNALIGQPTLAFDDLLARFTGSQIDQLALDRSAIATQLSASASHPLGDRGQWTLNLLSMGLSGTPASGDVAAVPAPGRDNALTSEILLNGLFRAGDTQSFALRLQQGGTGDLYSAGIGSRLPLGAGFRLTSRLRVDHRRLDSDDSRGWIYAPSLRLEYQRPAVNFELEAGVELDRRSVPQGSDRSTRRFFSAGYRIFLDRRQP